MRCRDFSDPQAVLRSELMGSPTNESIQMRWLKSDRERQLLLLAWAEHESALLRRHGWLRMAEEARASHPENAKFVEIETRLDRLEKESAALIAALPTDPTTDLNTILENLQVAECLVVEDEDPVGHGLIARAVRDLRAFRDAS